MGMEGNLPAGDFFYWAETAPTADGQYRGVVHFTGWRDVDDVIEPLDPAQTFDTPNAYRWAADALEAAHAYAAVLVETGELGIDR